MFAVVVEDKTILSLTEYLIRIYTAFAIYGMIARTQYPLKLCHR